MKKKLSVLFYNACSEQKGTGLMNPWIILIIRKSRMLFIPTLYERTDYLSRSISLRFAIQRSCCNRPYLFQNTDTNAIRRQLKLVVFYIMSLSFKHNIRISRFHIFFHFYRTSTSPFAAKMVRIFMSSDDR